MKKLSKKNISCPLLLLVLVLISNRSDALFRNDSTGFQVQKVKQQLNFTYNPFFRFSNIKHLDGDYHPFKLSQPISTCFEIGYQIQSKHFIAEAFCKMGTMNYYLTYNENLDSSLNKIDKRNHHNSVNNDEVKFKTLGIRLGHSGKLYNRINYELLGGFSIQFTPSESDILFGHVNGFSIIKTDSVGNSFSWLRVSTQSYHYYPKLISTDITFKFKYNLSSHFQMNSPITITDLPIFFNREYTIRYTTYTLNQGTQLSTGSASSYLHHLHFGIGISYVF